ncbi:DNA-3-methyladenine glycosylase I [soil metagenome]
MIKKNRCDWAMNSTLEKTYHDNEWGVPGFDDHHLFEMLILEGAQAGLSWLTVLKKRENYRKVFDDFNPEKIAVYDEAKKSELLANPGIIRNRLKVEAAIQNARSYIEIVDANGSFSKYIWDFVNGQPIRNHYKTMKEIPAETDISRKMSSQLKKDGFKFVGPTICYAYMQAVGMVNDHQVDCFRYDEI